MLKSLHRIDDRIINSIGTIKSITPISPTVSLIKKKLGIRTTLYDFAVRKSLSGLINLDGRIYHNRLVQNYYELIWLSLIHI